LDWIWFAWHGFDLIGVVLVVLELIRLQLVGVGLI
jgi:hypothetical protein